MVHDLEGLLEACLHSRQPYAPGSFLEEAAGREATDELAVDNNNAHGEHRLNGSSEANHAAEAGALGRAMEMDLHDEDAPGEEIDDAEIFPPIAVAAEVDGSHESDETSRQAKAHYPSNGIKASDTPPD